MSDLTFIEPVASRKFLHELPPGEATPYFGYRFFIDGIDWMGRDFGEFDSLTTHRDGDVILDVHRYHSGPGFSWSYCKLIAAGVYVRYTGKAESLNAACAAAIAYQPGVRRFEYLYWDTVWYETEAGRLTAVIDGEEASIKQVSETEWRFERYWAPAKPVLDVVGGYFSHTLSGTASSEKAAMAACFDATENFTRACAAFVATLTERGQ